MIGTRRRVRFTPQRVDDLHADAAEWVDRELEVTFGWIITAEDGGPYVGQTAWLPTERPVPFGWVPDCDITDVEGGPE